MNAEPRPSFRKSLRNAAINYRNGWFFVTCQVARNKSIFGAIVGDRCELNSFGRQVEAYWRELPAKYPELELDEFVLMPNHFHAIVRVHYCPTNKEQHLGFLMGRFKGGTGHIYGKLRRMGEVEDIGEHLWQFDYWDKIVTSEEQLAAIRRYIRENPRNWSRDRFGAVTQYSFGNLSLLNGPKIAFVASQGFWAVDLRPRLIWRDVRELRELRAKARRTDTDGGNQGYRSDTDGGIGARRTDTDGDNQDCRADTDGGIGARRTDIEGGNQGCRDGGGVASGRGAGFAASPISERGAGFAASPISERGALAPLPPIISTFTSAQEREALRRALAKGRAVIQAIPQGIPPESELPPDLLAACRAGCALLISPQPPGSRLNKKVATWCNEYVLRHATEIWAGDLSPNGMLSAMLKSLKRL